MISTAAAAAAAAAPCYAPYAGLSRKLETPCSSVEASGAGVEVRNLGAFAGNTSVIENEGNAPTFDAAVAAGAAGVFGYFAGNNSLSKDLLSARSVPLLVHPIEQGAWSVEMALAPSKFPSPQPPEGVPAPTQYPTVATDLELETGLIAAFHVRLAAPAREADFEACVAELRASLPKVAGGAYRVLESGAYFTPTYAYFYAEDEKKTFDVECWVEVERARAGRVHASNSLTAAIATYLNSNNETMIPTACSWLADGVTLLVSGYGNNTQDEVGVALSGPAHALGDDDPGPMGSTALTFSIDTTQKECTGISRIDNRIDVVRASPSGVVLVGDIGVAFTDPAVDDIVWQKNVPEGPIPGFEGRCLGADNATCRADVSSDGEVVATMVPLNGTSAVTLLNSLGNVTGADVVGDGADGCVAADVAVSGAALGLLFETGYCVSGGGAGAATVAFIRAKRAADVAGAPVWIAWGWRPSAAPAYSASTRGVRVVVGEDGATLAFAGACDVAAPGFAAGGCAFSLSPQNASRAANVTESDVYDSPSGFKCAATTTIAFHATFDAATGRQLWGRYNVALGAGAGHRTIASVVPAGIALSAAGDLYAATTVLGGGCVDGCASAAVNGQPVGAPAAGRSTGVLLVQPTKGGAAELRARTLWLSFAAPGAAGEGNSAGLDVAVRGDLAGFVVAGDHRQQFVEVEGIPYTGAPDTAYGIRSGYAVIWKPSAQL